MPLRIIRQDITKIKCDAIVNPTNEDLFPGGGVDRAIHEVAGRELFKMCRTLGGLSVGQAKMTPGYDLLCKYVIHTVGPWWEGGNSNEKELLMSCYHQALQIAKGTKCKSIAFPLISSGANGYPKDQVIKVAFKVIKEFLQDNDMLLYLVVYDKDAYELTDNLHDGITRYIVKNFIDTSSCAYICDSEPPKYNSRRQKPALCSEIDELPRSHWRNQSIPDFGSVNSLERFMYTKNFKDILFEYIDQKGISDVECYKRANVSRQTWHKITTDEFYKPKKNTIIALAISLQLNIEETQTLLSTMGFTLSKYSLFDVINMYCIVKKIYDVFEVDSILFKYDQETLFSKE